MSHVVEPALDAAATFAFAVLGFLSPSGPLMRFLKSCARAVVLRGWKHPDARYGQPPSKDAKGLISNLQFPMCIPGLAFSAVVPNRKVPIPEIYLGLLQRKRQSKPPVQAAL
jgi:hypothetical protein